MELKQKIMRKVYAIWFVKKVAPIAFLQMPLLLLIALRETSREFWVSRIFENFVVALNGGLSTTAEYVWSSFVHTPVVPVSIIIFSMAIFGYSAKRLIKNCKSCKVPEMVKSF